MKLLLITALLILTSCASNFINKKFERKVSHNKLEATIESELMDLGFEWIEMEGFKKNNFGVITWVQYICKENSKECSYSIRWENSDTITKTGRKVNSSFRKIEENQLITLKREL
jgi:hypothetical protein